MRERLLSLQVPARKKSTKGTQKEREDIFTL